MGSSRPAPTRRSSRANNRRAEILSAAAQLFLDKGYDATSVQDIADAVGLLKGSLFYYISEKEDLLYAVLEGMFTRSHTDMDEVTGLDVEPLVKVRRIAEAHVRNMIANRDRVTIFFRDFRSLSDARRAEIAAERDSYAKRFAHLLSQAQDGGAICPDIDVKLASGSLLAMLNMVHEWFPHTDDRRVTRLAQEIGDLVVASVACDPGLHEPGHRRLAGQA